MDSSALRLGELLVRAGLIDRPVLDAALQRQASCGERLGEALVAMRRLERAELPTLLDLQEDLRNGADEARVAERLRLGRLLVDAGALDSHTLQRALERSQRTGRRLGETLVEAGVLSRAALQRFLECQRRLAAVAVAGLAMLGAAPTPAMADQARVNVAATVLARAFIEREQLPQQVTLSSADIARGYVDLEQPVEVGIRTNYASGVVLAFSPNSQALQAVDVREAQGGELRAGAIFVSQPEAGLRPHTVSLRLRLRLAPDATPGTIAYPVTLVLAPG